MVLPAEGLLQYPGCCKLAESRHWDLVTSHLCDWGRGSVGERVVWDAEEGSGWKCESLRMCRWCRSAISKEAELRLQGSLAAACPCLAFVSGCGGSRRGRDVLWDMKLGLDTVDGAKAWLDIVAAAEVRVIQCFQVENQ